MHYAEAMQAWQRRLPAQRQNWRDVTIYVLQLTCPKAGLSFLVHFPYFGVLDGKHTEAVWVLLKDRLLCISC